jgi:hypothetical protein
MVEVLSECACADDGTLAVFYQELDAKKPNPVELSRFDREKSAEKSSIASA